MKYILLALALSGCASIRPGATIFLKESDRRFYNLQGETCLVSGHDVKPNLGTNTYRLVTTFSNCDCHEERTLEEFELSTWGVIKVN